jgi:hypothetical protein
MHYNISEQKPIQRYILRRALDGAETWTCRSIDQKYLESFEMWWWRRTGQIIWADLVRNEKALQNIKDINILHTIKRRKANWIRHIFGANRLLKRITED